MHTVQFYELIFMFVCIGPWEVGMTILPNLVWLAMLVGSFVVRGRRPRYNYRLLLGLAATGVAFVFFYFGLEEEKDYLRLCHGLWHACMGVATYFFFHCVDSATAYLPKRE